MEHPCIWWLAVTSTLYLCLTADLTEGRCKGSWAIHACLGGNGKRSPPLEPTLQNSILVKRLREFQQYNDDLIQPELLEVPETRDQETRLDNSIKRVEKLLLDMALNQRMDNQAQAEEFAPFGKSLDSSKW